MNIVPGKRLNYSVTKGKGDQGEWPWGEVKTAGGGWRRKESKVKKLNGVLMLDFCKVKKKKEVRSLLEQGWERVTGKEIE